MLFTLHSYNIQVLLLCVYIAELLMCVHCRAIGVCALQSYWCMCIAELLVCVQVELKRVQRKNRAMEEAVTAEMADHFQEEGDCFDHPTTPER